MFNRARLRLTLAYAALLGVTVVLVAGAIGLLAVREARSTDDRELKIRATAVEAGLPEGHPPLSGPPPFLGPPGGFGPRGPAFEQLGLLEWVLPVFGGQLITPAVDGVPGLPDLQAAQQAAQSGRAEYRTLKVQGSEVRIYSLPDVRTGQTEGVIQIARSRYFVNAAVTNLALIALVAGALGLLLSAAAGYWLAGRTLPLLSSLAGFGELHRPGLLLARIDLEKAGAVEPAGKAVAGTPDGEFLVAGAHEGLPRPFAAAVIIDRIDIIKPRRERSAQQRLTVAGR